MSGPAAGSPLRSNFEPGTTRWAMRRAQWTALGLSDEDMQKPKIAIVNSSSGLASCFSHLDGIVPPLKDAIRAAGGLPFEVRTAASSDAITSAGAAGQYILPTRDLIASDIEVALEGALGSAPGEAGAARVPSGCSWLSVYARSVQPVSRGATLGA